jgi:hypothetical protein
MRSIGTCTHGKLDRVWQCTVQQTAVFAGVLDVCAMTWFWQCDAQHPMMSLTPAYPSAAAGVIFLRVT